MRITLIQKHTFRDTSKILQNQSDSIVNNENKEYMLFTKQEVRFQYFQGQGQIGKLTVLGDILNGDRYLREIEKCQISHQCSEITKKKITKVQFRLAKGKSDEPFKGLDYSLFAFS